MFKIHLHQSIETNSHAHLILGYSRGNSPQSKIAHPPWNIAYHGADASTMNKCVSREHVKEKVECEIKTTSIRAPYKHVWPWIVRSYSRFAFDPNAWHKIPEHLYDCNYANVLWNPYHRQAFVRFSCQCTCAFFKVISQMLTVDVGATTWATLDPLILVWLRSRNPPSGSTI